MQSKNSFFRCVVCGLTSKSAYHALTWLVASAREPDGPHTKPHKTRPILAWLYLENLTLPVVVPHNSHSTHLSRWSYTYDLVIMGPLHPNQRSRSPPSDHPRAHPSPPNYINTHSCKSHPFSAVLPAARSRKKTIFPIFFPSLSLSTFLSHHPQTYLTRRHPPAASATLRRISDYLSLHSLPSPPYQINEKSNKKKKKDWVFPFPQRFFIEQLESV